MEAKKLLKDIEEDKILQGLTETLKQSIENAKVIKKEAEIREVQYRVKLRDYAKEPLPGFKNLDELEKSLDSRESRTTIARKIVALENIKNIPWRNNSMYREAAIQYYEYIIPILNDLENNKDKIKEEMDDIKARYEKEMAEQINKIREYDNKIMELFEADEQRGTFNSDKIYSKQLGYNIRADYVASKSVESMKKGKGQ
jgi:thermostable 8-oxoguanine DNA glycosylase